MATTYKKRIKELNTAHAALDKKSKRYPYMRLGVIVLGAILFYLLFAISILYAFVVAFIFLLAFAYIVRMDVNNTAAKKHLERLIRINQEETKVVEEGKYDMFPNGSEYKDPEHPYSGDLDIFGPASLFQFLNRTSSRRGAELLAGWLKIPALPEVIQTKQDAVKELQPMLEWRQEFRAAGLKFDQGQSDEKEILAWLKEPAVLLNKKWLIALCYVLPFITTGTIIASFWGLPKAVPFVLLVIHEWIIYSHRHHVEDTYEVTSGKVELMKSYVELIRQIENGQFKSKRLNDLASCFELKTGHASDEIDKLSKYVHSLDLRLNTFVHIPFNLLLLWDIRWVYRLEKWRAENAVIEPGEQEQKLGKWFDAMAHFEALSSLANVFYNNPDWIFPHITAAEFLLKGSEIGHPLIDKTSRVCNDIEMNGKGKIMLVTGSNMAGKSTYLRTVGVNAVLAMLGAPVCAHTFELSPFQLHTSMRISDSLETHESSFYAELKRLEGIIKRVENGEKIFFLLDEILRGTNSNDRHIGSKALIKQMIKNNGNGIVATHDLELGELEKEMPEHIANYSFDVQIDAGKLYFDYKMHPGICKSLNASILMKNMGIEI